MNHPDNLRARLAARPAFVALLLAATFASACGGCGEDPNAKKKDPDEECDPGTRDCACRSDDTCNTDLVCTDGTCETCTFGTLDCPCDDGSCGVDVCDAVSGVCRVPSECEAAGCAQYQLCEQPDGQDAVCLEECEPGFGWNTVTDSCDALPSCDPLDPGYCGDNRQCAEGGEDGDVCGGCEVDYVEIDDVCVTNDCAGIDCEGRLSRGCTDGVNGPVCGDCLDGFAEDDAGLCIAVTTCEDLNCQAPLACIYENGASAPACLQPADCPDGQVQQGASCVACVSCYAAGNPLPGVVAVGNGQIAYDSKCICELEAGYFQSADDGVVKRCDADADGWVNSDLLVSLNLDGNPNNPFAANQRCEVRTVDRFELVGDDFRPEYVGQGSYSARSTRELLVADLGLGYATVKLYEPEQIDDPTVFARRYDPTQAVPQELLRSYGLTAPVTSYGDLEVGHLSAAEVNPLTKACNHDNDDVNLDGVSDVTQIHGAFPAGITAFGPDAPPGREAFYKLAYFLELARGAYRDRTADCAGAVPCFGAYTISEKARVLGPSDASGLGFELTYDAGADTTWQTCMRGRDASYPGSDSPLAQNSDFAEWAEGCNDPDGRCTVGSGSTEHIPYDGRPIDIDRAFSNVPADSYAGGARFVGMNHSSQFKCVSFDDMPLAPEAARRLPTRDYVMNDCRLEPRERQTAPGSIVNPADPLLACAPVDPANRPTGDTADKRNWFVSLEHVEYGQSGLGSTYQQGCIAEGAEWGELLCIVEPNSTDPSVYGTLFCGCGDNRGGVNCELTCPDAHLLSARTANVTTGQLDGFFSCMMPSGSVGPEMSGGVFTVKAAVPAFSSPQTEISSGDNSFTLKPLGVFP